MSKFIISCGGTGGHLSPGIAIGEALVSRGHRVKFVISEKRIDSKIVEKYSQFEFERSPGVGFSVHPYRLVKFLMTQVRAIRFGCRLLRREGAEVVIGFGGFNTLGMAVATQILNKRLVLHEANRKIGKAVRYLSRFADRVYVPHGVEISRRKAGIIRQSGYPLRSEIRKVSEVDSKRYFGFSDEANILLVFGGSQGASALNDWVSKNFGELAKNGIDVFCISGPGKKSRENIRIRDENGVERELRWLDFCDDMAKALSCAKVVVGRAGAGSIAEFARCGVVPILVPYPLSADNHQMENAEYIEKSGGGLLVRQDKLYTLTSEVLDLMSKEELLESMRLNLSRLDEMNEIGKIVLDLEKIAEGVER